MDSTMPGPQLSSFRPIHTLSQEEIQQERAEIDTRIRELESSIRDLQRRRNTLSPVFKLSTDVLLCVFEHLQNPFQHDAAGFNLPAYPFVLQSPLSAGSPGPEMQMDWVRPMTHVCSAWRTLAIETPTLWTRIKLRRLPLALRMIQRTKSLPISLVCDFREIKGGHSWFAEILKKEPDRIKHLEIAFPSVYTDQRILVFNALKTLSTKMLEALYCRAINSGGPGRGGYSLPLGFLQHSSNNLRYLTLDGCNFHSQGLAQSADPINLPSLLELTIASDAEHCAETLRHVIIPNTCVVSIVTFDHAEFGPLMDALRAFWQRLWHEGKPLKSVSLLHPPNSHHSTKICLGDDDTQEIDKSFVLILAGLYPTDRRASEIIDGFISSLPGERITRLRVRIEIKPRIWLSLSNSCPNAASLEVRNKNLTAFFNTLGNRGVATNGDAKIDILFLSLKSLTLRGFDFGGSHGRNVFLAWLTNYRSSFLPFKRLTIFPSTTIPDEFVETLKELVEELDLGLPGFYDS
ncbi:hypothetical protein BDN72DRAFT_836447 [Pluteus cervinus]|uniref:Uncharacterized protein n=1 Tax=Pluteus cervinus TaxID=181527 RepID=A0ACD3B2R4_9AGAR|nr:hypothetical protein BDN72DRAFT_836447 [Pluteus cervinus]